MNASPGLPLSTVGRGAASSYCDHAFPMIGKVPPLSWEKPLLCYSVRCASVIWDRAVWSDPPIILQEFLLAWDGWKVIRATRSLPCSLAPVQTFCKWRVKEGAFLHLTHRWVWTPGRFTIFLTLLPCSLEGSGSEMLYHHMDRSFWTFCPSLPWFCCIIGIPEAEQAGADRGGMWLEEEPFSEECFFWEGELGVKPWRKCCIMYGLPPHITRVWFARKGTEESKEVIKFSLQKQMFPFSMAVRVSKAETQ